MGCFSFKTKIMNYINMSINNKICNYGFCLSKNKLTPEQIKKIKNDLSVTPESNFGNFVAKTFTVYKDTPNYIIVPIYYGLQDLEIKDYIISFPKEIQHLSPIQNIISLRENQKDCFQNCINEFEKPFGGGIITLNTGMGKCLAKDTKVIMYNGTTKKVQDLKQGDLLMGDDNTPRTILTLTKGFGKMYTIVPVKGQKFTVNKAHILVLKNSMKKPIMTKRTRFNRIRYNVIWWENNELQNKLFKTEEESTTFLDEATSRHQLYSEISVGDWLKTSKAFRNVFKAYRVSIDFSQSGSSIITSSRQDRIKYITDILDSYDTRLDKNSTLYFCIKNTKENEAFKDEFIFVCRSVGLYTNEYPSKDNSIKITIQGNIHLPLKNKELNFNCDYKDYSMTSITIKYKERNEYYGFTLDGNHRFLFEDFTVTHNTVLSLKLIAHSQKKTLVIVNKIELLNQWKKEIEKWIPDAKIGIIQGSKFEYEDCHIVIGMLQTIAIKKDIKVIDFTWVENCIIDECHNISSEVFSNIMFKVRPRYIFGLTATLERKDKLEKVIKWYIGDSLYDGSNKNLKQTTQVYILKYFGSSSVEKYLRDGTAAVATMLSNISNDLERTNYIIDVLKKLIEDNNERNILVISDRISQLKYINTKIPEHSGLFIGSMKSNDLELTKQKRIVLGTYPLVNEGFNLPKLNCLVFATPRSSITQAIGRIYRKDHIGITPIIIDIMDNFSIFKGQHYRRKKIYKTSISNCEFINKELQNFSFKTESKVLQISYDSEESDSPYDLATKILSNKCLLEDE
jgi:superfamily II DNA or RNA helicase